LPCDSVTEDPELSLATHRYSIWIDAAPELVWEIFTDLDRIPEWQTGGPVVVEASGRGDVAGTTYAVRRGPGIARAMVLEAVRPFEYRSRTSAQLGLVFETIAHLVPEANGTRLELEAQTHWPLGMRLLGRLVEAVVLSGHEGHREMKQLKLLVESRRGRDVTS
jgi:uncharacterized protein YndB with AHSA1/START domain